MTSPGFWLIVALVAVTIVAPSLVWLADRVADAYDALRARHARQRKEDAATFGEPVGVCSCSICQHYRTTHRKAQP